MYFRRGVNAGPVFTVVLIQNGVPVRSISNLGEIGSHCDIVRVAGGVFYAELSHHYPDPLDAIKLFG